MKWKTNGKRFLALLLTAVLLLSVCPVTASAEETDGLCPHHTAHDATCGYVQGSPCTHEHVATCYEWEKNCTHEHAATCYSDGVLPAEGEEKQADTCTHECSEETGCLIRGEENCTHQHIATECGYVEGHDCEYQCSICAVQLATVTRVAAENSRASSTYVLLHPATGTTPTGVKVSVGDTISGYPITSINGYDITVDLGTYNVHLDNFRIPYPEEIWEGVATQYYPQTYVIFTGVGSSQKSPGASVQLANAGNQLYYYNLGPATGGTSYLWNFTLQYDANGGSGAPQAQTWGTSDKYTKSHTFTVSSTTPTREGYAFKGWSDSKDGTVKYSPNGSCMVSQTVGGYNGGSVTKTIYAVWEEVAKTPTYAGDSTMNITKKFVGIDSAPDGFQLNYSYTDLATSQVVTGKVALTGTGDTLTGTLSLPYYNNVATGEKYALTITEQNADVNGYTMNISANSANNINQQAHSFQYAISATTESTLNRTITNTYTKNQSPTDWSGLTITKTASPSDTVKPGDTITYTITVKNGTGKDLKNVTVSEKLNENLTFANATPSSQYDKDKGVWTIDTLANNGTAVLTITATVNKDVEDDTKIANTAAITGAEDSDGGKPGEDDKLPEDSADVTVTIPQEDSALTVTKTADKAEVAPGETVTYTIRVKNNTSETISGIVLKDTLPAGLTGNMEVTGGGFTSASGEITFESFDLAAGKTKEFTVTVAYANVTESVIKTNTATATSGDKKYTDTADVTVEPAESTEVAGYYIMKITKSFKGISEVPEGFYLSYQYTDLATQKLVTGRATLEASTDDPLLLKGEIMYPYYKNPTSPNYEVKFTEHNADVEGYRREVRSGGSISIMYAVKDPLTYTVYSVEQDGLVTYEYLIENTYSKNTNWDSLTIGKTADKTEVKPGDTVTYTITVENKTGKDLKDVTVSEQLDTNLIFVSATPNNDQYDNETGLWTIATLANNATATLTIKATVKDGVADGTTIGNTATITDAKTDDDETLPEDDQPADSVEITVKPDEPIKPDWNNLIIVKSANPKAVKRGETITYTIRVNNNTGVKLDTVTVQETPDSNLTVTGYSQGAAYDAEKNVWTITGLENGAEATLTVTATVNTDTTASVVKNTAAITSASAEGGETLTGNPSDSVSVTVTDPNPIDPEPETDWDGLTLKKTANRSSVRPGKTITYTLTVTNKTGKDLTDIVVSEKLDANLTFVSSSGDGKYDVKTGEWTIGKLENGGKATLTLKATVKTGLKDGTVIKNTACITDADAENGDTLPTDAQPSGSAKVTVSNKISLIPETGDTSNIGLWIGVLVACAVVLGVVLILTVKKKKTR